MSNMMCTTCHKVGEPYQKPSCEKPDCPATAFGRMLGSLTDPREAAFNELQATVANAGVVPTALDWFKAGVNYARRADDVPAEQPCNPDCGAAYCSCDADGTRGVKGLDDAS